MKWQASDEEDRRVVEKTDWRDVLDYGELGGKTGIFIFVNHSLHVKYIGSVVQGGMAQGLDTAIRRGKHWGAQKVMVLYADSETGAVELEGELKGKYRPSNCLDEGTV